MRSFVFVVVRSQGLGSAVLDYQKTENSSWIFQSHRLESWRARTGQFVRELPVWVMDTDLRWWRVSHGGRVSGYNRNRRMHYLIEQDKNETPCYGEM